ncbi:DNA repair protein rad2 [Sorochytrium milnesiophthora]
MGVKGLWTILAPSSRAIRMESLAGKVLAIDASIWLYQFLKALRDKEGNALRNAHIMGFFRRVCKLLFLGVKPVFVFDGGAPALKRSTVKERRQRREGKSKDYVRTAEKLLSSRMRAHALNAIQQTEASDSQTAAETTDDVMAQNIVYHEELELSHTALLLKRRQRADEHELPPLPTTNVDPDKEDVRLPYLPEELEDYVDGDGDSTRRDIVLALRDHAGTPDFDSQEFSQLPVEVQHDVVHNVKEKSRQQSHRRLASMIRSAPTALDFSRLQVKNLMNRNYLTQKLHEVTGFAGAGKEQRVASDRHRKYVFVKNEDGRGWRFAEEAQPTPITKTNRHTVISDKANPAFPLVGAERVLGDLSHSDGDDGVVAVATDGDSDVEFEPVAATLNDSAQSDKHDRLATLMASVSDLSSELQDFLSLQFTIVPDNFAMSFPEGEQLLIDAVTNWSVADCRERIGECQDRAGLARSLMESGDKTVCALELENVVFLEAFLEDYIQLQQSRVVGVDASAMTFDEESDDAGFIVLPTPSPAKVSPAKLSSPASQSSVRKRHFADLEEEEEEADERIEVAPLTVQPQTSRTLFADLIEEEENLVAVQPPTMVSETADQNASSPQAITVSDTSSDDDDELFELVQMASPVKGDTVARAETPALEVDVAASVPGSPVELVEAADTVPHSQTSIASTSATVTSPVLEASGEIPHHDEDDEDEEFRMAEEEEEEFTRFLSELSNKDLASVRSELDNEINVLHAQKRRELRDSETVTPEMVRDSQRLLGLFGIPFVVSPMEAEAQCAFLTQNSLVDGIVTDDSDVFLFGGTVVYKNMFNQAKYVERYAARDIEKDLSVDRERMIRLAYLLGSDYTEGLQGVGAVTAMEIVGEWQGENGLAEFKHWINSGSTDGVDSSSIRKKLHKSKVRIFVPSSFPDPRVRDAYLHPQVDTSLEEFQWGHPDIAGLKAFLWETMSWSEAKVDESVIPLLKRMNELKRIGLQTSLDMFLTTDNKGRTPNKVKSKRMQHTIAKMRRGSSSTEASSSQPAGEAAAAAAAVAVSPEREGKDAAKKKTKRTKRRKGE